jgi:hypothetical protein
MRIADDMDRQVFLETLGQACGRTGWRVHAYVLMSDPYHLLLCAKWGWLAWLYLGRR